MELENTINNLLKLLYEIETELRKTQVGNKAASRRARTKTIQFEKIAKVFRKESVVTEKS